MTDNEAFPHRVVLTFTGNDKRDAALYRTMRQVIAVQDLKCECDDNTPAYFDFAIPDDAIAFCAAFPANTVAPAAPVSRASVLTPKVAETRQGGGQVSELALDDPAPDTADETESAQ